HLGQSVPIWLEDGGDGRFGPGDRVEFVGHHLPGEASWASPHSRFNVYWLRLEHPSPRRMEPLDSSDGEQPGRPLRRTRHFEKDLLLLRFPPPKNGEADELWYWARLVFNQKEPFRLPLFLEDLAVAGAGDSHTVDLRVDLRGWSWQRTHRQAHRRDRGRARSPSEGAPERLPDHRVEVLVGDRVVAESEWDGRRPHRVEVEGLPTELFAGHMAVSVRVPRRQTAEGEDLIDVVMLDAVEVSYPRQRLLRAGQTRLELGRETGAAPSILRLRGNAELGSGGEGVEAGTIHLYGVHGSRTAIGNRRVALVPRDGEGSFFATAEGHLAAPEAVVADHPSQLKHGTPQTDYLIVTHPELRAAIEPLADMHRRRGLSVTVAVIDDVYDEFAHGIQGPRPLRAFVSHAYHHWPRPAPRFVLLVGDASWDVRNEEARDTNYADWGYRPGETTRFVKNQSTPYTEGIQLNNRFRVPTWTDNTAHGHSASDNFFVAVDGDDDLPDLAIGRLPVVSAEEVAVIVEKTRRYLEQPEVGPWRREMLLITNEQQYMQRRSDDLASRIEEAGWSAEKVYPNKDEKNNAEHSQRLIELFDRGQLLVHFLGHGGRYIWRTGPPDFTKNHDLFTLDHLDQLEPHGRLPVVLSLTCSSAPFDHPSADSIGEKLLRLDGRGAVAVFAASWRNSPTPDWSQTLFEELTRPGATVGEAILESKRRVGRRLFVRTYNLLGDPALPVSLPEGRLELEAELLAGSGLGIRGRVRERAFSGTALVEVLDADGKVLLDRETELEAGSLELELALDPELDAGSHRIRVYAWNAEERLDALGA
ncbi:MAG: C25 family cysteine peptidase, partial [Holophagales bacterium]|nr:C25 family cysteine peptidase [Holophagales bacterium]